MKTINLKRFAAPLLAILIALTAVSISQAQNVSPSELQFREAMYKQQVEGDLAGAITLYQSIVSSKSADPSIKARALLQLAACYEKLGRQSEVVYQQIVREFADQPAATQAKAKLATLRPPTSSAAMTMRKIETGTGVENVVATDGQRAVYWDQTNTILYIGDLAGKERREVYRTKRAAMVVPSRDLSIMFLFLPLAAGEEAAYAVIKSDGTAYHELALTERGQSLLVGDIGIAPPACLSWSWDNRYLLMCKRSQSGGESKTRLLKITVADATVQDLLPNSPSSVGDAQFSPDGRFVAYHEGQYLGPIKVMPAQGGASQLIVDKAALLDWTRDGRYLMIAASRTIGGTGVTAGLTAVPMQNGQTAGEPIPIQASLPPSSSLPRMTSNGAIVLQIGTGATQQVQLGSFDAQDHFGPWKPLELVEGGYMMSWSPDSRQIVYVARGPMNLLSVVRVRNIAGSEDREVYRSNNPLLGCLWAHHANLYCAQPAGGKTEILNVALDSGHAEKAGELDGTRLLQSVSADDRVLYTTKVEGATGHEWVIGSDREKRVLASVFRSADGRWALGFPTENGHRYISLRRADSDIDAARRVVQLNTPGMPEFAPVPVRITDDGNWIIYRNNDPDGKSALYRIATIGGEPERLAEFPGPNGFGGILLSPDGKHVIIGTTGPPRKPEFWALENFLPATASRAPRQVVR